MKPWLFVMIWATAVCLIVIAIKLN